MIKQLNNMGNLFKSKLFLTIAGLAISTSIYLVFLTDKPVDYSEQVKPIINQKCISCHGGVKKKGDFSLLFREEALAPTASGKPAIIPGDAENSDMIKRLYHTDPEERMPYHEEPLTDEEKNILARWIDEGANFETHWAYQSVKKQTIPGSGFFSFFKKKDGNDIDRFIDEKLDDIGLSRSIEAEKKVLLRRVSLDLIGIPAPDSIATKYINNNSPKAYEELVDALLASEHYGEKWTSMWLDLARYADTRGYEKDDARSIWRYRDWLINAFNQDKPYDVFLTEQLAGDLMPNATDEQYIATAFHRNTMTNDEGGTDSEEFRTAATIDRTNTTWEALMGTSFACVQCHSHPYDPFRHEDYYKFMAYFNNSRDEDTYNEYPLLREFRNNSKLQYDSISSWLKKTGSPDQANYFNTMIKTGQQPINSFIADSLVNATLWGSMYLQLRKTSYARIKSVSLTGKSTFMMRFQSEINNGKVYFSLDSPTAKPFLSVNVEKVQNGWGIQEVELPANINGKHDLYINYENASLKSKDDNGIIFDWIAFTPEFPGKESFGYLQYKKIFYQLINNPDAELTPIMMDNPADMKRPTHVFERGNWKSKTKLVEAGLPEIFHYVSEVKLKNRFGLAQWMTNKNNPLTSRTMMNRLWEQLFGQGLVETLEDLGSQGAKPTHQELLDHLSYTFMHEDNWSIKKSLKRLVMSATYKQTSQTTKESLEKDALNRYYSHAPRVRLSAEQIRDQALSVCGIMSTKMFGPSVMPYQPEGIWASPYDSRKWVQSEGENQYRRAVYTYWRRSSPYPSMINFDGVTRDVCMSRRIRTNTPLQALTILNDSAYWDISVQFAKKLLNEDKSGTREKISKAYELATGLPISKEKLKTLDELYNQTNQKIRSDNKRVASMLSDSTKGVQESNLAALAVVTNVIFNLDEVITKN
ncbi:MAG: DUF1553 domain-containing protein [bacterium]